MMKARQEVCELILKALEGRLGLEEFYSNWPKELEGGFWDDVYDNLESAIEHFPYGIFSRMPDYEVWHNSGEYRNLLSDLNIIRRMETP